MHRTLLLIASIMAATPSFAIAADRTATALDRCLGDPANSSTGGQTTCETQAARSYDHRLNIAYQGLLKTLPPAAAQQLRQAQRAWLDFRAADAKARSALYGTRQGTMYAPMQAHAETVAVRDRALQLEADLRVMQIEP